MRKDGRLELAAFIITVVLLIIVAVQAFEQGFYYSGGSAIACILLATIPVILRRYNVISFPLWMALWYFFLLWLHSFGILHDYYGRIDWFDELTHTMAIGLAASTIFLLLILLNHHARYVRLPALTFPLFMIIFAMGLGVTWEVIEFVLDVTVNTPMQYSLADSVSDMMTDLGGGLLASSVCLIYLLFLSPDEVSEALKADRLVKRYQRKYQHSP